MSHPLRYEKAKLSAVYIALVDDAVERLLRRGSFSYREVLKATGYDVFAAENIRWDYVRRMIEEQHSTELIPLSFTYFERHPADKPVQRAPEHYMAGGGHGKITAGFAIASERNAHFVHEALKRRKLMVEGSYKAFDESRHIADRVGVEYRELPLLSHVNGSA